MDTLTLADAGHAPALIDEQGELSFQELSELSSRVAACLCEQSPGDGAVAFVAHTERPSVVLLWAIFAAGRLAVPLHPRWTEHECAAALAQFDVAAFRADPRALLAQAVAGPAAKSVTSARDPERPSLCLFTSGTSGAPKGVILSARALVASARGHVANLPFQQGDRWFLALPLAHAGGVSIVIRSGLAGSAVVLAKGGSTEGHLATIRERRVTILSLVPTQLARLLDHARAHDLARIRYALLGGAALSAPLRKRAAECGFPLRTTYGLTETGSQVVTARAGPSVQLPTHVGKPLLGVELEVRGEAGQRLGVDEPGQIFVRGPMLMSNYLGERVRGRDAWHATGDLGRWDPAGDLHVLGRQDETIISGGENVHPSEIETALQACPEVEEAVAFGVPHELWGQQVGLAVVLDSTAQGDAAALQALVDAACRELARFKKPRALVAMQKFPLLASGKIDRRQVAAQALEIIDKRR